MPFHQLLNGHFLWFLISNIFPYPLFLQSALLFSALQTHPQNPRLAPYSNEHPFDIFVLSLKRRIFSCCFESSSVGLYPISIYPTVRSHRYCEFSFHSRATYRHTSELISHADRFIVGHSKTFFSCTSDCTSFVT